MFSAEVVRLNIELQRLITEKKAINSRIMVVKGKLEALASAAAQKKKFLANTLADAARDVDVARRDTQRAMAAEQQANVRLSILGREHMKSTGDLLV